METLSAPLAAPRTIGRCPCHPRTLNAKNDPAQGPWNVALIQTKTAPPRPPRGRVGRQALVSRLARDIDGKLTVVIAPAGFGKTTLLAEWCEVLRAKRHLVAWLSLDEEDDDQPQQFAAYVLAALSHGPDGVGRQAQELLHQDPLTPGRTIISVLLNEIAASGRQIFLVLDDFHLITSTSIRAAVSRLLRYAPENFHLLIGTRSEPGLSLGQFQAHEQLLRLDAEDLRFSADDAQCFFAQAEGVALDRPSVELLHQATEGWVAGLQLASLGLRQASDAARVARELASNRFGIDAYLDDTVLAHLPSAMQQFLLRTSLLDRLSAGVCDALMGAGARSWEKLDWLERHNIFIRPLDADREWFRFHSLLSDALRRRAARQLAGELPALHRRASRWFAAEHLWPEAVRHALAAGEVQQAASWVEHCALAMVDRSDVRTVLAWIAKLPPALVRQRLRLRLAKAWALALSLQTTEATEEVRTLTSDAVSGTTGLSPRTNPHGGPAGATDPEDDDSTLPAQVNAVQALIAGLADDSPRSLELGREAAASPWPAPAWVRRFAETAQAFGLIYAGQFEALRRMDETSPLGSSGGSAPIYASVYRESMLGLGAYVRGRLPEALRIFEAALARAEQSVGRCSAATVLPVGYLAAIHYERNDLARASELLADRTAIAMEACPLGSLLRFCRTAACLYARRGDLGSALVMLEDARETAAARGWLRLRAGCDAEAVRLCLGQGRIDQARQLAQALRDLMPAKPPCPMGSFLETWTSHCTLQARLDLAEGRPDAAAASLAALRLQLAEAGMDHVEACTAVLQALAQAQGGAHAAALETLGQALAYAEANGMVSSFVQEGEPLRRLLLDWQRDTAAPSGASAAHVATLLAAFDAEAEPGATPGRDLGAARATASEQLSARETEILDHISRGLSNKEIGRALRVAPETIKWHLKNIFEKLNVASRIEAVQSGLGLTPAQRTDPAAPDGPATRAAARGR